MISVKYQFVRFCLPKYEEIKTLFIIYIMHASPVLNMHER